MAARRFQFQHCGRAAAAQPPRSAARRQLRPMPACSCGSGCLCTDTRIAVMMEGCGVASSERDRLQKTKPAWAVPRPATPPPPGLRLLQAGLNRCIEAKASGCRVIAALREPPIETRPGPGEEITAHRPSQALPPAPSQRLQRSRPSAAWTQLLQEPNPASCSAHSPLRSPSRAAGSRPRRSGLASRRPAWWCGPWSLMRAAPQQQRRPPQDRRPPPPRRSPSHGRLPR